MGVSNYLLALILILIAAGCAPVETPGREAAESMPAADLEQAAAESAAADTSEEIAAASIPEETRERPTATSAPVDTPEQPTATSVPPDTPEPLSDEDAAQIYAAAIRQMTTVDHSFGGDPPDFPLVFIVNTTSDGSLAQMPKTPPQKITADLQQAIEAGLADLPFEITWVESLDDAPMEQDGGIKIADGKGIILTMGNILAQEDGTVHLPFYMLCGSLCLSGKTYVLEAIDGAWQVTGNVGAEVEG